MTMQLLRSKRTGRAVTAALAVWAAFALDSGGAAAQQQGIRPSDGVSPNFRSVSATDDASAIWVNPANLAFLPAPEARLLVMYTSDEAPLPIRGYAADFAAPLWIFATGLRVDFFTPPPSAPAPFATGGDGRGFDWIRWASAVRFGDFASLGMTLQWSTAEAPELHDHFSVQSGLTVRPNRFLSGAVVARDWNSPENDVGQVIDPSVDMAITARPLDGRKYLEIGLEASYRGCIDFPTCSDDGWVPGANLAFDIPWVGRFHGGAQLLDPSAGDVYASAAVEVSIDSLQFTAGTVFGNALGLDGTGFVAGGAIRGYREEPSIPLGGRIVRIRMESTPELRSHDRWLRALWRMADDPEVDGVLLVLRSAPAPGLAHAEELVDAIDRLKANGKKVLCHLEDAGGRELFVCSAADKIAMNPAGGLHFAGLSTRLLYFGGLLDKIGVRADFVRIGAHKAAAEMFDTGATPTARDDHVELVHEYEKVYMDQVARGRKIGRDAVEQRIERGPYTATEARDAGLVDTLVYEDEIDRWVDQVYGDDVKIVDYDPPTRAPKYWRDPPKVAVVYLHGDMIDGESSTIPIVDIRLAGSYTIAKALKRAREDASVKAVVFRIETGGGSTLAADVILREATLTARKKPLVVSMAGAAASGGYYASVAPGAEIFANRSTLTGSIGIFYGKVDVIGLMDKLGVRSESYNAAPRADAESFFRPFTDDERNELGHKVKQWYDLFVARVAEGRKLTAEQVDAVARGKVWIGEQAAARKLVDHVGGLRQAIERARELGDLAADAPVLELPEEETTLLEMILELVGIPLLRSDADPSWVPPPLVDVARALLPFAVYSPYKPLARMEMMVEGP
jgi:protease IV